MGIFKDFFSSLGLGENVHQDKTILLVDDDIDVREILAYALQQPGLKILEAENGQKALELIDSNQVDLLIADYYMPKMNGAELLNICQKEGKYLGPAIMISATINEEIATKAEPYNLAGLLAKIKLKNCKNLFLKAYLNQWELFLLCRKVLYDSDPSKLWTFINFILFYGHRRLYLH